MFLFMHESSYLKNLVKSLKAIIENHGSYLVKELFIILSLPLWNSKNPHAVSIYIKVCHVESKLNCLIYFDEII